MDTPREQGDSAIGGQAEGLSKNNQEQNSGGKMSVVVVSSSQLGIRCWSPRRFLHACFKCKRYLYCKYLEREVDFGYEQLRARLASAKRSYLQAIEDIHRYKSGSGDQVEIHVTENN